MFIKCKKHHPNDVHIRRLMAFMVCEAFVCASAIIDIDSCQQESMDFKTPSTWNGYRLFGRLRFCDSDGM